MGARNEKRQSEAFRSPRPAPPKFGRGCVVHPAETGLTTYVESEPPPGGRMGRKPRIDRTPEEKSQILQEGLKGGNVSETCRRHGIAQTLFYRWKDEAEQGAKAALW